MRAILASNGLRADIPWLPGLLHIVAALSPLLVFNVASAVSALVLTTLVSFVVYVPLTALALNGGAPIADDHPAPDLTPRARVVLLVLWTATIWATALAASLR